MKPSTNKNKVLHSAKPTTPSNQDPKTGWDPFEVWRTRVLLPRLAEKRDDATPPAAPPHLVRS